MSREKSLSDASLPTSSYPIFNTPPEGQADIIAYIAQLRAQADMRSWTPAPRGHAAGREDGSRRAELGLGREARPQALVTVAE